MAWEEVHEDEYGRSFYRNRWQGRGMVIFRILWSIIIPSIIFYYLYWLFCKETHHFNMDWVWIVDAASWIFVGANFFLFWAARLKGRQFDAKWQLFNTAQASLAVLLATFLGNQQYHQYWDPILDFQALETYVNVNPAVDIGDEFLDGGQIYFKEGSHVDTTRGMAFKTYDVFCLAPIIKDTLEDEGKRHETGDNSIVMPPSGTVDFFAVGKNCCLPNGEAFSCGDVGSARSGLRVLEAEDRPYYKMAAEAWAEAYKLPAKHPIFLKWSVDPMGIVGGMAFQAGLLYEATKTRFVLFNLVCLVAFLVIAEGWDWSGKGKL